MMGRGVHHVTVIATGAARNLDFYRGVLGLHLEKRTVTHEDPGAYHLMYGRGDGAPGRHLTFFCWSTSKHPERTVADVEFLPLAIPLGSIDWWEERLRTHGIPCRRGRTPFGRVALKFEDPDRTALALVSTTGLARAPRPNRLPPEVAVIAPIGATLSLKATEMMTAILTGPLGFVETRRDAEWAEFSVDGDPEAELWLHRRVGQSRARLGPGKIHHIAFRAKDDDDQAAIANELERKFGIVTSPVRDRYYFRSIYFRGPDGLLIEISTDGPGLLIDESPEDLGSRLIFPPGIANREKELLRILPTLE